MPSNWIQTHTGRHFYLDNPHPEQVDIRDIAWALSNQARYNGHTKRPYSVAEHCCHVHDLVPPQDRAWALLHDASEAYLGDVVAPLKSMLPDYKKLEDAHADAIAQRYRLGECRDTVRVADLIMLCYEARFLLDATPVDWPILLEQEAMEKGIKARKEDIDHIRQRVNGIYSFGDPHEQFMKRWRALHV